MKTSHIIYSLLIATTILQHSCVAPKPVVRVIPTETQTTWEQGKQFVSYQKNDFVIHTAYQGLNERYLIFDVEVINNSQNEFLVAPEKFVMYTDSGKWDPITNKTAYSTLPIYACDPEYQILKLDMQASVTEANIKNQQTAAAVIAIASIPVMAVSAVADANDDTPRVVTRTDLAASTTVGLMNGIEIGHEENINQLNVIGYNLSEWNQYALRKTTLSPGESIRGLIYFQKPNFENFKTLKIEAPIPNNNNISFIYQIVLYYPSANKP